MRSLPLLVASLTVTLTTARTSSPITGIQKGFNYAATTEDDFRTRFTTAKNLVNTSGFTSARLYTMIAPNTINDLIPVFQPAIDTGTKLLLGLYCSAGQEAFNNEIAALKIALQEYKTQFSSIVVGISVGSEDLYRTSVRGTPSDNGVGDTVQNLQSYIKQTKSILADAKLDKPIPVGHVDTWQMWMDSNSAGALIPNIDFIGLDGYPYWQNASATDTNAFMDGFNQVRNGPAKDHADADGTPVPVWVTETGFPNAGGTRGAAEPKPENAELYWKGVGCGNLFDKVNTWWYILQDSSATDKPSFGIVNEPTNTTAMFDLDC